MFLRYGDKDVELPCEAKKSLMTFSYSIWVLGEEMSEPICKTDSYRNRNFGSLVKMGHKQNPRWSKEEPSRGVLSENQKLSELENPWALTQVDQVGLRGGSTDLSSLAKGDAGSELITWAWCILWNSESFGIIGTGSKVSQKWRWSTGVRSMEGGRRCCVSLWGVLKKVMLGLEDGTGLCLFGQGWRMGCVLR